MNIGNLFPAFAGLQESLRTSMAVHAFWKLFRRKPAPVYTTRAVQKPDATGTWVAEIYRDGVPVGQIKVGSISALSLIFSGKKSA
jgi:hypothetical protein